MVHKVHRLLNYINNLIPLAKTVLFGGLGISAAMIFSAFLMTVFAGPTCAGYLIYLAAQSTAPMAFIVAAETVACAFFIHFYIVKFEND